MTIIHADNICETTSTTGTGTLTLAGAVAGRRSFSVLGDGARTLYQVRNGGSVEVVIGTYTLSGSTLTREILIRSTTGSKLNLSGTSTVEVTDTLDGMTGISCNAATSTSGTLSTSFEQGDVINGVTLDEGMPILIKDQASGVENGPYQVAASGSPTRDPIAASGTAAHFIIHAQGRRWVQTATWVTIGSGSMVFEEILPVKPGNSWHMITDGAAFVIDWQVAKKQQVTLGASRSPSFANAQIGQAIRLKVGASGAYSLTWPSGIVWSGGSAPTQTAANGKFDEYIFECVQAGAYVGYVVSLNTAISGGLV